MMFINNFSNREKNLALVTLSVVSIVLVYVLIIDPIFTGWKNINDRIKSKIDALERDSQLLANRKTVESEYAKLSKYAKSARSEEQGVADTLAYIENVSRNDACTIINIKPIDVATLGSHKEILIDVNVEASIEQLSKFLYDIENPRDNLINVRRFTISAKSGQAGTLKGVFVVSKVLLN